DALLRYGGLPVARIRWGLGVNEHSGAGALGWALDGANEASPEPPTPSPQSAPGAGKAVRLGLTAQRFRERDDLPVAPGVRHGGAGRRGAGARCARWGGRVRGGIREARGGAPGGPGTLARADDRARVFH